MKKRVWIIGTLLILSLVLAQAASAYAPVAYQVRPGDTLCGIAAYHGTSCKAVIAENPQVVNPNLIHAGDWVYLPRSADISQGHRNGFLTAMSSELEGQLALMEDVRTYRVSGRVFYAGEFEGKPVVMAMSEVGMNNSSITTQALFEHFDTCPVFFSGIAGAGPEVEIGDVMIVSGVTQHDYGAFVDVAYPEGLRRDQVWSSWSETGMADTGSFDARLLTPDKEFYNLVWSAASQVQLPEVPQGVADYLTRVRGEPVGVYQPRIIQGYVASGNQFVWSWETLKKIEERLAKLTAELGLPQQQFAVEMEGYGFALTAESNGCHQWIIVRVMSDEARQPDITIGVPSATAEDPQALMDWMMANGLGDTFANVGPVFGSIALVDQTIVRALPE